MVGTYVPTVGTYPGSFEILYCTYRWYLFNYRYFHGKNYLFVLELINLFPSNFGARKFKTTDPDPANVDPDPHNTVGRLI